MAFKRIAPRASLSEEQIRLARDDTSTPASHYARAWGVSAETIRKARRGETWNWLPQKSEEPYIEPLPLPETSISPDELKKKEEEGLLKLYKEGLIALEMLPEALKERAKS